MDENIILKYRREFDCWVCDECDIENEISSNFCIVCNAQKPPYPTIIKAWSPGDEYISSNTEKERTHSEISSENSGGRIFYDDRSERYSPPPPPKDSMMSGVLICLIVFIIIFICLIIYGLYGA